MGFAAIFPKRWWLVATPVFVGIALLFAFVYPYLVPTEAAPAHVVRDARTYAGRQGTEPIKVVVEEASEYTTIPNAYAAGLGPSRRIVLWDTLLDGRFEDDEVRVVLAHEIAHHSRQHLWKGTLWYALLLLLLLAAVARFTLKAGRLVRASCGAARAVRARSRRAGAPAARQRGLPRAGGGGGLIALETTRTPRRLERCSGASRRRRSKTRPHRPGRTRRSRRIHPWSSALRWRPPGTKECNSAQLIRLASESAFGFGNKEPVMLKIVVNEFGPPETLQAVDDGTEGRGCSTS